MTTTNTKEKLFDVVSVSIDDGTVSALFGEGKTLANAEAIVKMAVMRRGVDTHFYAPVTAGSHRVGDKYDNKAAA